MGWHQLVEWATFEEEFGPLTIHERLDWQMALRAYEQTGKGEIADHLPQWRSGQAKAHFADWLSAMAR